MYKILQLKYYFKKFINDESVIKSTDLNEFAAKIAQASFECHNELSCTIGKQLNL